MRILVPIDGSDPADAAFEYALEQFTDDEIVALNVIDPVGEAGAMGTSVAEGWISAAEERAETILEEATETASEFDRAVTTDSVIGRPAHAIVEYAEENDIDQIVLGSHGRDGLSRVLLGSVAETVVRRASVPVTVTRSSE